MMDYSDILLYNSAVLFCVTILAVTSKLWFLVFLWFLFRIRIKIEYEDDEEQSEERGD